MKAKILKLNRSKLNSRVKLTTIKAINVPVIRLSLAKTKPSQSFYALIDQGSVSPAINGVNVEPSK